MSRPPPQPPALASRAASPKLSVETGPALSHKSQHSRHSSLSVAASLAASTPSFPAFPPDVQGVTASPSSASATSLSAQTTGGVITPSSSSGANATSAGVGSALSSLLAVFQAQQQQQQQANDGLANLPPVTASSSFSSATGAPLVDTPKRSGTPTSATRRPSPAQGPDTPSRAGTGTGAARSRTVTADDMARAIRDQKGTKKDILAPTPAETTKLVLEKWTLYETKTRFYCVASNQADSRYRVLKLDRTAVLTTPKADATADGARKGGADAVQEHEDEDEGHRLNFTEDHTIYSKEQVIHLLETLNAGNSGGVNRVEALFYGIAGFVKFTTTYYMVLIKARAPVALIGGHYIYHCEETALRPVCTVPPTPGKEASARKGKQEEARLMAAFQSVDMTKNFYFSYTYDLTHTLQHNLTSPMASPQPAKLGDTWFTPFNDKFVWNRFLLKPTFKTLSVPGEGGTGGGWVLPLVHGFVDQAKLNVFGRPIYVTLIARRSRHFAGARFLKRGVNEAGYVANDVETEQIVSDALVTPFTVRTRGRHLERLSKAAAAANGEPATAKGATEAADDKRRFANPRHTSFVQVRGSIPLFWSQETINMSPKPPIELTVVDPYFSAAALHFDELYGRYGGPVTVLNLIKHKERAPRESKLLPEFKECIDYLNQFLPAQARIKYIPWDIAAANKLRDKDVIGVLEDIAETSLESTHLFHTGPEPAWYALTETDDGVSPYRSTPMLQSGVVRTNCIDCLDRTNAAQFVIGKAAFGHQLHALGVTHDPRLPFDSDAVNMLTEMYHDHGDTIALQYGGSHLVNTTETYRKIGQWSSHSRDMVENLRRYYANSFVDADKQVAIDLFLGIDTPAPTLSIASKRPRRSYREWYTKEHFEPPPPPSKSEQLLNMAPQRTFANFWLAYYRPKLFTEVERHFAYKMNCTLDYNRLAYNAPGPDYSPFIPRLAGAQTKLNVPAVRRWMSRRSDKATLNKRIQSQRIDEGGVERPDPATPSNTTEALAQRLLDPSVDPEEAQEYKSYIDQFSHLSLSQDLSENDALLYRSSAFLATGGVTLAVDALAQGIYADAVQRAQPQQRL